MALTLNEEIELHDLMTDESAERVSPKMERFRGFPKMIMGARGGRGAGAKSWGFISLLVQEAHREKHNYLMLREFQNSLKDSAYKLVLDQIKYLGYRGWIDTREHIVSPTGSEFVFKGLKDKRSENSIQSFEGFDRFYVEEASDVSASSIDVMLPTVLRNDAPAFIFVYNPKDEFDPITTRIWNRYKDKPENALLVEMEPCEIDNPWWPKGLKIDSDEIKETDPDRWEHIYGG